MTKRNHSKKKKNKYPIYSTSRIVESSCHSPLSLFLSSTHTHTHDISWQRKRAKIERNSTLFPEASLSVSVQITESEWQALRNRRWDPVPELSSKCFLKTSTFLLGMPKPTLPNLLNHQNPFFFFWVSFLLSNLISGFVSCRPVVSLVYPLWVWFKDNNFMSLFSFALFCVRAKLIFGCFIGMPQLGQ